MEGQLLELQAIGDEIRRIIINFNKDSKARKTPEYLESRRQQLEDARKRFEDADSTLQEYPDLDTNHSYFTEKYFDKTLGLVTQYKNTIAEMLVSKSTEHQGTSRQAISSTSELVKQYKRHFSHLSSLLQSIEEVGGKPVKKAYCKIQLEEIQRIWERIEEIYLQLEVDSDVDFRELQSRVLAAKVRLSEELENHREINISEGEPARQGNRIHLPRIEIPKFDGTYLKWRQFHDLYLEVVHKQNISACEKFWYLRANLAGEAADLIKHLPITEDNYITAWNLLNQRYENTRLLVNALLSKLLSQPAASQEAATHIKSFHDTAHECLKGLNNLGVSTETWDPILLHLMIRKLDKSTHTLYEQSLSKPRELQSIHDFMTFLENRFQSLEALGSKSRHGEEKRPVPVRSLASTVSNKAPCVACKAPHAIYSCNSFRNLSTGDRLNLIKKHDYCVNCLQPGHKAVSCTRGTCRQCNKKHHTLLHLTPVQDIPSKNVQPASTTAQATTLAAKAERAQSHYMMLGTVLINVHATNGTTINCRAILDSGSQINVISERLCKRLNLHQESSTIKIQGLGNGHQYSTRRINVKIESRITGYNAIVEAFVLPVIVAPQPTQEINIAGWKIPDNIQLADPEFHRPERVDILLGVEFYYQLLSVGQIQLGPGLPILQNTLLGWVVAGKISNITNNLAICAVGTEESLADQAERFWRLDNRPKNSGQLSPIDKKCETHFAEHTTRNAEGRYEVALPFVTNPSSLGASREIALRRFYALENKLQRNPELKAEYIKFMDEYRTLNHMELVTSVPENHYFLPHHCVVRPEKSTTKVRVVFDASAKTTSNISLNDTLMTGPPITDDLFTVLLRFRVYKYVMTADAEKMYRQILVRSADQAYQLIFWRESPDEPLRIYQLKTVTYGTRPAPYLAIKCLHTLAKEGQSRYPYAAKAIMKSRYVDDFMVGCNTISELERTHYELTSLLSEAGFNLRKWCANNQKLLNNIPIENTEQKVNFKEDGDEYIKTLGVAWLPQQDLFKIIVTPASTTKVTKRIISSDVFRIFDPLGLVAPVVTTAKIFLQQAWQLKLDWDAALPSELHTKWLTFRDELKTIEDIKIPRHIFSHHEPRSKQLHIFADASTAAYGAVAYMRSINPDKTVIIRLICAKSHVAPLKTVTLPRLELCAAKLGVDLADRIKEVLDISDIATYFWTDSEIVLSWINSESSSFHTFVANRISAIHELSHPNQWRHVGTKLKPADLMTRPISPRKLQSCTSWFYGPLFLHSTDTEWSEPFKKPSLALERDVERKATSLTIGTSSSFIYGINHKNSFGKLLRITGYVFRFINRCRKISIEPNLPDKTLNTRERRSALKFIVKSMQEEDFKEEIVYIKKHNQLHPSNALSNITPFLDEDGILRVGGRIQASRLSSDAKHPMLLPYLDPITRLIMEKIHKDHGHIGSKALINETMRTFWPLKGKIIARSIVHKCVKCTKANPKMFTQLMGNLPENRVQLARPFLNSGVDFCGPVRYHFQIRGKHPQKAYIAVFCCFATKAVHLELVSNLTTSAFLGALSRFISRRGHCENLYCDNATNFVGARNQLQELTESIYSDKAQTTIRSMCSENEINFHFIPPRAPHFGGLWEAAVKSAKNLLFKIIEPATLTQEMLQTALAEVEAILNSRPLTAVPSDPNDLDVLTPGHFLIGEPLLTKVNADLPSTPIGLNKLWDEVKQVRNEFWKRWSKEYLNSLQQRYKWKSVMSNVEIGTMVIIKDDNLPAREWPLGRIVNVCKGADGLVRVVDVRTGSGNVITRAIHRLAPLPVEPANDTIEATSQRNNTEASAASKSTKTWEPGSNSTKRTSEGQASHSSQSGHRAPRKQAKMSRAALLATLFACLVWPTIASNAVIDVETQQVHTLGVHYEPMGSATRVLDEWRLIVYYDLAPYYQEVALFMNGSMALHKICEVWQHKVDCKHLADQLDQEGRELQLDNELFSSQRKKRGAVDIIGNIANSLFGVLDSNYAKENLATINTIRANEQHLLKLLKNQTSLIDSTANIMTMEHRDIERKFQQIDQQLSRIINAINGSLTYEQNLSETMSTLALQLIAASSRLHRIQSAVVDALTDAHHGMVNPLLLSPQQLRTSIKDIWNHLPTHTQLPTSTDNLLGLYKLMKPEGSILNNCVLFTLGVPLISTQSFDLFKLTPIPIRKGQSLVAVKVTTNLLAINTHRDSYFTLTDEELSTCNRAPNKLYVCQETGPLLHKGSQTAACEYNLLVNGTSTECNIEPIATDAIWIQLRNKNRWVYALNNPIRIQAICENRNTQIRLEGSGILTLRSACILKHDLVTITGYRTFQSELHTSYAPFDIFAEIPSSTPIIPRNESSQPYHPHVELTSNITKGVDQLLQADYLEIQSATEQTTNFYHGIPGYLSATVILAALIYIIWRKRNIRKQIPTPAQRTTRHPDFSRQNLNEVQCGGEC